MIVYVVEWDNGEPYEDNVTLAGDVFLTISDARDYILREGHLHDNSYQAVEYRDTRFEELPAGELKQHMAIFGHEGIATAFAREMNDNVLADYVYAIVYERELHN